MNRRILIIIILTAGCISQVYTADEAQQIATDFITNAPTFNFDGSPNSLEVTKVEALDCTGCFEVTLRFVCENQGFGDRSAYFLVAKPTPHIAKVSVEKGKVTRAVIDGIWDEMTQTSIAG